MNVLSVEICTVGEPHLVGLRLLVDARDLRDRVREHEAALGEELAGRYGYLPAGEVLPPARHLLGEPAARYSGTDGRTYLLICDCGDPGCWPLEARVTAAAETVTWSGFRQPHRPAWSYEDLGPFTFERGQYEGALRDGAASLLGGGRRA